MTRCLVGAVSALALMASAGIAVAQSPKGGQDSGPSTGGAPSVSPPSAKSEAPGQTKPEGGSAKSEAPGQMKERGSSAADEAPGRTKTQNRVESGDKGSDTKSKSKSSQRDDATDGKRSKNAERNDTGKTGRSADRNDADKDRKSTTGSRQGDSPRQAGREGGGKDGASAEINLPPEQKTKVVTTFKRHRVEPVRDLNINVSVGTVVPRKVHLHPIPQDIVVIAPAYRRYKYFVFEDRVVIVEPATYEIVDVLILA